MDFNAKDKLEKVVVSGLEKCAAKLTRISAGSWNIADAGISWGTLNDAIKRYSTNNEPATAIYFDVKGDTPFTSIIIFDPKDIEFISKCFLGFAFPKTQELTQAGELLLSELANIILNSFISSLSNTLGKAFLPSVPKCIQGEPQYLLEALGTALDSKQRCRLVNVTLAFQCDMTVTRCEFLGVIPEKLEAALSDMLKAGGK